MKVRKKHMVIAIFIIILGSIGMDRDILAENKSPAVSPGIRFQDSNFKSGAMIKPRDVIEATFQYELPEDPRVGCFIKTEIQPAPKKRMLYHFFTPEELRKSLDTKTVKIVLPVFEFDLAWSKYKDLYKINIYWGCGKQGESFRFGKPAYTLKFKNGQKRRSPYQIKLSKKSLHKHSIAIAQNDFNIPVGAGAIQIKKGSIIEFAAVLHKSDQYIYPRNGYNAKAFYRTIKFVKSKGASQVNIGKYQFEVPNGAVYAWDIDGKYEEVIPVTKNVTLQYNGKDLELNKRTGIRFHENGVFKYGRIENSAKFNVNGKSLLYDYYSLLNFAPGGEVINDVLSKKREELSTVKFKICNEPVKMPLNKRVQWYDDNSIYEFYFSQDVTLSCDHFLLHAMKGDYARLHRNGMIAEIRSSYPYGTSIGLKKINYQIPPGKVVYISENGIIDKEYIDFPLFRKPYQTRAQIEKQEEIDKMIRGKYDLVNADKPHWVIISVDEKSHNYWGHDKSFKYIYLTLNKGKNQLHLDPNNNPNQENPRLRSYKLKIENKNGKKVVTGFYFGKDFYKRTEDNETTLSIILHNVFDTQPKAHRNSQIKPYTKPLTIQQKELHQTLLGKYQFVNASNDWHTGVISKDAKNDYYWTNNAGVSFRLILEKDKSRLAVDPKQSPWKNDSRYQYYKLQVENKNGKQVVTGFYFNNDFYKNDLYKPYTKPLTIQQKELHQTLLGEYQFINASNYWHTGVISKDANNDYYWTNNAGISFRLTLEKDKNRLALDPKQSPWKNSSRYQYYKLQIQESSGKPVVTGFYFNNEFYQRIGW